MTKHPAFVATDPFHNPIHQLSSILHIAQPCFDVFLKLATPIAIAYLGHCRLENLLQEAQHSAFQSTLVTRAPKIKTLDFRPALRASTFYYFTNSQRLVRVGIDAE